MKTAAWETAPQIALRDCSKEAVEEGQNIRFWWRGSLVHSIAYLTKDFMLVTRSWCHHKGIHCFSRYEEVRGSGSWNQFLKTSIRRPVLPVSLKHRVSLSTLNSFGGCWSSTAAAAQGSISAEADGKCPWQAPICSWQWGGGNEGGMEGLSSLSLLWGGGRLTRWPMGTSRGLAVFQKWLLRLQRKEWVTVMREAAGTAPHTHWNVEL